MNRGRARLWPIVVDTFASNRLVTRISVAYIHAVLHPRIEGEEEGWGHPFQWETPRI